jgi:hypothetical protein
VLLAFQAAPRPVCSAFRSPTLRRVRLARHRLGLTEEQRYPIADETIREMRRFGGWRDLDGRV